MGRLVVVLLVAMMVLRLVRRAIRRVDDNRFREQLLFFVPKAVGVIIVILGLAAIGIDVSGDGSGDGNRRVHRGRSSSHRSGRTSWPAP